MRSLCQALSVQQFIILSYSLRSIGLGSTFFTISNASLQTYQLVTCGTSMCVINMEVVNLLLRQGRDYSGSGEIDSS